MTGSLNLSNDAEVFAISPKLRLEKDLGTFIHNFLTPSLDQVAIIFVVQLSSPPMSPIATLQLS